jgi:D-alanyl-D-alanine carboxypeptidase/D-alanyl-D-alanine-endopeptidase (penicillin-binding protein 4)
VFLSPLLAVQPLAVSPLLGGERLAQDIAAVIQAPEYRQAHWGILAVDLADGRTVYELNSDWMFAPASVTKLYSVAAALDALGADCRFETPLVRHGEIDKEGQLRGDLILVAGGDLTLGGRTNAEGKIAFTDSDHTYANGSEKGELTEPDPLAGLNELARQAAQAGIKRLRGEVLMDDRLFDRDFGTGSGPRRLTPIMVNDNLIDFLITPGDAGKPAQITWRPQTAILQVDAQVETVAAEEPVSTTISGTGRGVILRGKIPSGHKPLLRVYEVPEAAAFARGLLIEALVRAGIAVDASPIADRPQAALPPRDEVVKLPRVALFQSPPFSESARLILKVSHNLHASTLPLLLAAKSGKRTLADGLRLQHDFLARAGVEVDTISFGGGAGGSQADLTTPRATIQLLRHMHARPDAAAYKAGLPVLGIDGTLHDAVEPDSPALGKIQAKTGTYFVDNGMNGRIVLTSKALAGYMTTATGRNLAFAIFINNAHLDKAADTTRVGKTLGRLCEIIYMAE